MGFSSKQTGRTETKERASVHPSPQASLTCSLSGDESQGELSKQEGPLESTGPPALPQGVPGTAALGPGVRGGHRGVCSDLSLLICEGMGRCVDVVNYHDACHPQIV